MNLREVVQQRLGALKRRFCVVTFSDGRGSKMAVVGDENYAQRLARRFFCGNEVVGRKVEPRLDSLVVVAERLAECYGMALVSNLKVSDQVRDCALHCPRGIEMELSLPTTVEAYFRSLPHSLRKEISQLKKTVRWEFTHEEKYLAEFRDCYNIPTLRASHGSEAHEVSLEEMRRKLSRGYLLRVFHDGRWVAGAICSRLGEVHSLDQLGLIDGERNRLPRSITTAIYWASIEYGIENGFRSIDFGRVMPDPFDGLFYFKSKWGAKINGQRTLRPPHFFFIDPAHPHCRRYFREHAMFFWEGDQLSLLTGFRSFEELERMERRSLCIRGVERVYTIRGDYCGAYPAGQGVDGIPVGLRDRVFRVR